MLGEQHVTVTASIGIASARDATRHGRGRRPQRRRRDVHGQGQRQGRLRGLRSGHARGDPRAPRDGRPAPARRRARPAPARPTSRSSTSRDGAARRRRGARPLAASRARPRVAGRVHRDRRGERRDPADRPLDPARGLPRGDVLVRRSTSPCLPVRQRLGARDPAARLRRRGPARRSPTPGWRASRLSLEITETALLRATPKTVATLEDAPRSLASGSSSTTSGPATSRSATCASSRSTSSRSRSEFVQVPDSRRAGRRRWPARSSPWAARSRSRRSPRGSRPPSRPSRMRDLGCAYGQGYHFAQPIPGSEVARGRLRSR